jgi:SRSO17 transposase
LYALGFSEVCAVSRASENGGDLDAWLTPFLRVMGRSTRSKWAPLYLRGLLGSDGPKSVQPIASRLGLPGHNQLHHFVSSAAWDDGPVWRVLAEKADSLLGGDDAVLVVDDTALKKGTASVGVTGNTAALWASRPTASAWCR